MTRNLVRQLFVDLWFWVHGGGRICNEVRIIVVCHEVRICKGVRVYSVLVKPGDIMASPQSMQVGHLLLSVYYADIHRASSTCMSPPVVLVPSISLVLNWLHVCPPGASVLYWSNCCVCTCSTIFPSSHITAIAWGKIRTYSRIDAEN